MDLSCLTGRLVCVCVCVSLDIDPNRNLLHPNAAADFLTKVLPPFFVVRRVSLSLLPALSLANPICVCVCVGLCLLAATCSR